MSYRENQRKKALQIRDQLLRDPGDGIFFKKRREFVLNDATLNLWSGIRADAQAYFKKNNISWWMGRDNNEPTGHLLSSQIACINHLYSLRQRSDLTTELLRNVSDDIVEATMVDDGYVEFEVIGGKDYLNEKARTRGANCTSIDALMVGRKKDGKNILVLIEWKYTEDYKGESKYIPQRAERYDKFLSEPNCPITLEGPNSFLYYEPFYQLMRQTLLGWRMAECGEYSCNEYLHIHVIPEENTELLNRVTSPGLEGKTMSEAWQNILIEKQRYIVISPEKLLTPIQNCPDTMSVLTYLRARYWEQEG